MFVGWEPQRQSSDDQSRQASVDPSQSFKNLLCASVKCSLNVEFLIALNSAPSRRRVSRTSIRLSSDAAKLSNPQPNSWPYASTVRVVCLFCGRKPRFECKPMLADLRLKYTC